PLQVDDLDKAVEPDEGRRGASGGELVHPHRAVQVGLERRGFGLRQRHESGVQLAQHEPGEGPVPGEGSDGKEGGDHTRVPEREAVRQAEPRHSPLSPSRKPRAHTVWMSAGRSPESIFRCRWLTCTSTRLVRFSGSSSQTDWPIRARDTTWPAWRIRVSRIAYSFGVRAIAAPPRVTRCVSGSRARSATLRTGGRTSSERRSSARIRARSSSKAKGLVR